MKLALLRETFPGERRVALVPANLAQLAKAGVEVVFESGAGVEAGFPDSAYLDRGARLADDRAAALAEAEVLLQVRGLGANPAAGRELLPLLRPGQVVIAACDPLGNPHGVAELAAAGVSLFAMELVPRITRAQAVDILSSMATIAGYRAVLLAAMHLPKMLPMVTYAAGMLKPARVFIVGAGVAGLRAISTAKSLGAAVTAHDIRPTSREEVQSVGAKFIGLEMEGETQDAGGYARQMDEDFYRRQRELIARVAAESDVVITTAAIPGRRSPLLITAEGARGMQPGSVIVDLAAERGGNCELTRADEVTVDGGVTILGPTNLPAEVPGDASTMYSNNLVRFLAMLIDKEKRLTIDRTDEVVGGTLAAHGGEVVHPRVRQLLELPELPPPGETPSASPPAS